MNTTYFLNCVSGNVFGSAKTPALPQKYYLGLSTSAPALDGSNVTEPSASTGYTRVEVTGLSAPQNGVVTNTAPITFNESLSSWGIVTHYVLFDSPTSGAGNLLIYGALPAPRTIDASTIVTIKDGCLILSVFNQ